MGLPFAGGIGLTPMAFGRSRSLKRSAVMVVIGVLMAAAAYWYWSAPAEEGVALDLVEAFRGAEKRTTLDPQAAFSLDPQTIKGETKPAVFAHPPSRIIYKDILVPEHARLEVFLGIKEEAWDKGTDGVYFRVGVSHGEDYRDLAARHLDPYRVAGDRGWVPLSFDLSEYAGKKINVVFNTHESAPGGPNNGMYDFAVFGAPRIVVRPPT
jgi:hypothetical protein